MMEKSPATPTPRLVWVGVGLLTLWIILIVTAAQWRMAPTFDEQNHVTRGISIWRTGDYRLIFHHPPLANLLQGLPVAWGRHGFSTNLPEWKSADNPAVIWDIAHTTIWANPVDGVRIIRQARIMVLLFTLVLAAVIFLWARELFGPWGGLLSLALFAFDPSMLAHSGLATTDMAAASTIVLAVYLLRRYLRSPTRPRLFYAGLGVGLAFACKFTSLILLPIGGLLLLLAAIAPHASTALMLPVPRRLGRVLIAGVGMLCIAGLVLWASYRFKVEAFGSKPGQALAANASLKEKIPIPAFQYLRGIKAVASEAEGHRAYLLGKTDTTGKGWWYYFPVAMAVKTPAPALLLLGALLLIYTLPRLRGQVAMPSGEGRYLLLPVIFYLLAALGVLGISLNLGIRHLLPLYPFLYIFLGGWAVICRPVRARQFVLGLLVLLQVASVAKAYPDFLAYFNEPSKITGPGYHILIDSNIDWGQDLPELARMQHEEQLYPLTLSYFGTTPPEAYRLRYHPAAGFGVMSGAPPPNWHAQEGYLAVSVTNLMGGKAYTGVDYQPVRNLQPWGKAGESILIYRFRPTSPEITPRPD